MAAINQKTGAVLAVLGLVGVAVYYIVTKNTVPADAVASYNDSVGYGIGRAAPASQESAGAPVVNYNVAFPESPSFNVAGLLPPAPQVASFKEVSDYTGSGGGSVAPAGPSTPQYQATATKPDMTAKALVNRPDITVPLSQIKPAWTGNLPANATPAKTDVRTYIGPDIPAPKPAVTNKPTVTYAATQPGLNPIASALSWFGVRF